MSKAVDYQKFCPQGTSKEERRRLNVGDIFSNSIRCKLCKQKIRSKNKHDYVTCKCGTCSVDGGSHYTRYGGGENAELLIEYYVNEVLIEFNIE